MIPLQKSPKLCNVCIVFLKQRFCNPAVRVKVDYEVRPMANSGEVDHFHLIKRLTTEVRGRAGRGVFRTGVASRLSRMGCQAEDAGVGHRIRLLRMS